MDDTKVIFFQVSTWAWCSACESPSRGNTVELLHPL